MINRNIQLPSTTDNLVTLANSILARFGVETFHQTLPEVDEILARHKKIVFILFDGAGSKNIEKSAKPKSVLKTARHIKITSVFPPTTVAATNAFLSGRYPSENGWLGWSQYFSKLGRALNVFHNVDSWTKEKLPGNEMNKHFQYTNIFELVAKNNPDVRVNKVMPSFEIDGAKNLRSFYRKIRAGLHDTHESLTYAYWTEPDSTLHMQGTDSKKVKRIFCKIDRLLKRLSRKHKDTLFVVLADHGLVDVKFIDIKEHDDFFQTLVRPYTLEGRAANFYVKPGQSTNFEDLFRKYYGKFFRLYTKSEIVQQQVFGPTQLSDKARYFIGDYLAVALDEYAFHFSLNNEPKRMLAHHAGLTEGEMSINLTIIND